MNSASLYYKNKFKRSNEKKNYFVGLKVSRTEKEIVEHLKMRLGYHSLSETVRELCLEKTFSMQEVVK